MGAWRALALGAAAAAAVGVAVAMFRFRYGQRAMDETVEAVVTKVFKALQFEGTTATLEQAVDRGVWRLLRPIISEQMEENLREGLAIYGQIFDAYKQPGKGLPISAGALYRRATLRRRNFLDPPPDAPYLRGAGSAGGGANIYDDELLARAQHFLELSEEIYADDADAANINARDIYLDRVEDEKGPDKILPRHAVFADHLTRSIAVVVRGTASLSDAILDLNASPVAALGGRGKSHKGINNGAEIMLPHLLDALEAATTAHPDYTIVVTGHSLGAGTALMLTLMLRNGKAEFKKRLPRGALDKLECYAFAPPPVWRPLDALTSSDLANVYSFAHNTDLIPRCSLRALQLLAARIYYIENIDVPESKRIKAVIGPDGEPEVESVLAAAETALSAADADAADGAIDLVGDGTVQLRERMYIPGRVFHLYPAAAWNKSARAGFARRMSIASEEGAEDAGREDDGAMKKVLETPHLATLTAGPHSATLSPEDAGIDTYRIHEIGAEAIADAPIIDSDWFVVDHDTAAYVRAFRRLEMPEKL